MGRLTLSFEVFGLPAPQGSKRCFNNRVVDANSPKLKAWRKIVKEATIEALQNSEWAVFDEPVEVTVKFYIPRGKTVKREYPTTPPDLDKLVRSVFDSLTDAKAWGDDSQVCKLTAYKVYADDRESGAYIEVRKYNETVTKD